ncbi:hypothetical protein B1B_17348, partial [mine drainage metagenome]
MAEDGNGKREVNPEAKEHWRKGNSLFESSKFAEAIAEFGEAVGIDPEYSDAYFNRALAERIAHKYEEAKADLQKVMELEPKSPDAPLLYGDMAEASNDLVGAKYWYEKSLSIDPNYSEAKNRLEHIDSLMHVDLSNT